jgi:pimeloyl-ACP methyl ester carboxylesterase
MSALRDNVRQSAMELSLLARALPSLTVDTHDCPGASASAAFDGAHLALMGHSMGAWIAPLALAFEPTFGAAVLSGAGGSYIANVMDKQKPLRVRPYAEILLDYNMDQRSLDAHDPALTLLQWEAEPSDPQAYDRRIVREPADGESPRNLLMLQGIVDHYILPSIANATSLAIGLDAAGPMYDAGSAEEQSLNQIPLATRLPLANLQALTLPMAANIDAATTALVIQHPGDGIEDGHEVVFQTDPPKHQYRCFLVGFAHDVAPNVPPDGAADDPCP